MIVFFILIAILFSVSLHNLMEYTNRLPSEENQCWQTSHLFLIAYKVTFFAVFRLFRKQAPFQGMETQN